MALSGTQAAMAQKIVDNIKAINPKATDAFLLPYWTAISKGIIDQTVLATEVLPGTFVDSLSAPITGKGALS